MAEKNDQKMRERAERAEKFQAKLQELLALAKKKKNMLEYQEINDHFKDFALSPEQIGFPGGKSCRCPSYYRR